MAKAKQAERPRGVKCVRCGYQWEPRTWPVKACPRCKSYFWDRERVAELAKALNTGK